MRINGHSLGGRLIDLIIGCLTLNIMSLATARSDIRLLIKKEVQLPLLKWCSTASPQQIRDAIEEIEAEADETKPAKKWPCDGPLTIPPTPCGCGCFTKNGKKIRCADHKGA